MPFIPWYYSVILELNHKECFVAFLICFNSAAWLRTFACQWNLLFLHKTEMQDSLDFILLFWLPAVANFLRLQLLCEFFVTSVWWAVIKFTGQGCALESWLYTSIFLSIPLKSPLQKLKIKFILLEFSQQTLVRNVVASDLLRGLFFFWKRCDGEFWAWWLWLVRMMIFQSQWIGRKNPK